MQSSGFSSEAREPFSLATQVNGNSPIYNGRAFSKIRSSWALPLTILPSPFDESIVLNDLSNPAQALVTSPSKMTNQSERFERNNSCTADSNCERTHVSGYAERDTVRLAQKEQLAQTAKNQSDLVDKRVIPNVEIENKSTTAKSDWASARVEARQESAKNILAGNPIHQIRYGDTLWDVATASFHKNIGHKPNNSEIMAECNRLAKKNRVTDINNIAIGTKIDTSPDNGSDKATLNARVQERFRDQLRGRSSTPTWDQFQNRPPNYYDLNGGSRRSEYRPQVNAPNYYDYNGGLSRTESVRQPFRVPETTHSQPFQSGRLQNGEIPLTPETTRQLLQGRRNDGTPREFGPININPGMEISPHAKNSARWRGAHDELVAKARRGAPDVAFYGDSITQGLQLNPNFKTSFGGRTENFGIGGDTNQNLLYRLKNGEANFGRSQPETAVLLIGTNNIGSQTPDKIAAGILANAREMTIRMPGTEIVVMGILPRGFSANDPLRRQVNAVNETVRRQLEGVPGVKFVDIGPQLLESNGNMRAGIYQRDNVHLTSGAGYNAMLRALQPYVRTRR